jgi:hypothetical protein
LALEITDNKVEHLAAELFGVHLETTAGLRYFDIPGGIKVLPNPKLTLRGGLSDKISPIYGLETCAAIMAGPVYQEDVRQKRDRTDAVSMVVSQWASEGATLFAALAPMEATLIKDRLYK